MLCLVMTIWKRPRPPLLDFRLTLDLFGGPGARECHYLSSYAETTTTMRSRAHSVRALPRAPYLCPSGLDKHAPGIQLRLDVQ